MEITPESIVRSYKDKEEEFQALWTRMDEDLEVWEMSPSPANLTAYHAGILRKTKQHGSDLTIVSNELRTNCDNVQSILSSSDMQIMVRLAETEGIDLRAEIGKLERLFYFLLEQGDLRLRQLLLPSLREMSDWHALVRGWRAARILNHKGKAGKVLANYIALDPRYLVYDVGAEGLLWVGYKTFKSQAAIKSEWDKEGKKKKDNEVIDYWYFEEPYKIWNAVVSGDVFLKDPEVLKMRSMPFVIIPVSTRPPIADATGTKLKGYGDSLFASGRQIHAVRNRFATIATNWANILANQVLIHYRAKSGGRDIPGTFADVPGATIELTMGEDRLEASPMQQIPPAVLSILSWLSGQVQATLLPPFQMEDPAASGTRASLAMEASNKIFNPQIRSLNHFYEGICRLIEEQLIDGGIKVKVKSEMDRKYYAVTVTPVDLKKEHRIKVEFTARTPWEQMDTAQVAQMLKSLGLPDGWIWENILKVQDPKALADLAAIELYEHSPEGAMSRAAEALVDVRGDFAKAILLVEKMDSIEAQERMATEEAPPVGGGTPPEAMPPEIGAER